MQTIRILAILIGLFSLALSYDSIDDALSNGIASGDLTFYGNYTNGTKSSGAKNELNTSAYSVASVGLAYHSAFYKYIRIAVSFRAAGVMWQDNRHSTWGSEPLINNPGRYGSGDASRDFYMNDRTMLGQTYAEYFDGDTSVRVGRVFIESEWADRLIDGVSIKNQSLTNLRLEAYWARNNGYVQYNKMTGFYNVNTHNSLGLTQIKAKYYIGDLVQLSVYGIATPSVFYAAGGKVFMRYDTSKSYVGTSLHFATSFEQSYGVNNGKSGNGYNFDWRVFFGVKDIAEVSGGFIGNGANVGWGSLNTLGNNISPFFMWGGRALLEGADVNLWYGKAMFKYDRISFAFVYGNTKFRPLITQMQNGYDRVGELNLLLDFGLTEHLSALLNVMNTHGGKKYYPHATNVALGIKLAF